MATIKICDNCEKRESQGVKLTHFGIAEFSPNEKVYNPIRRNEMDLCSDCFHGEHFTISKLLEDSSKEPSKVVV